MVDERATAINAIERSDARVVLVRADLNNTIEETPMPMF
jgi:hypothetical protein